MCARLNVGLEGVLRIGGGANGGGGRGGNEVAEPGPVSPKGCGSQIWESAPLKAVWTTSGSERKRNL